MNSNLNVQNQFDKMYNKMFKKGCLVDVQFPIFINSDGVVYIGECKAISKTVDAEDLVGKFVPGTYGVDIKISNLNL